MRIAYVINSVEGGGAAFPVPAVVAALTARGASVRLFALTRRDGRALPAMHAAGLATAVRDGGERDHGAALRWLDAEITAFAPDLIWSSLTRATLLGQLVGLRHRIAVVSWQHAEYLKPANLVLLRATQRLSKLWIADSDSIAALTAARLGVPPQRLATWPLFAADPAAPLALPWQPGEPVRIGSLGRLHPVKGYDILIEAFALLRERSPAVPFTVEIAGEGVERERLMAQASAAGVAVRFRGFEHDPSVFLAGLHLYVQPSRGEGLCIAAHEAMQTALPVIGAAVGEMPRSIVDGVTGRSVPPGDAPALAAALAALLAAPDRLAAMGAASRTRLLARFGPDAFSNACDALMQRLPLSHRAGDAGRRAASPAPIDRPA